jgi:predicted transcriptional regulator
MNNKKNSSLEWKNPKLNLQEAFSKGDFASLIAYVEENEMQLQSILLEGDLSKADLTLKFASCLLGYFESNLEGDFEKKALFKLGELTGYLRLIEFLRYEENQNQWAMAKLEQAKKRLPNLEKHLEKVIMILAENVTTQEKELIYKAHVSSQELEEMIEVLIQIGLVQDYTMSLAGYRLTDMGIRLVSQISKK